MLSGRALVAARCAKCRLVLLRSFTSISGPSIRTPRITTRGPRYQTPIQQFRQLTQNDHSLSTPSYERSEGRIVEEVEEEEEFIEDIEEEDFMEEQQSMSTQADMEVIEEETQVSEIPWYLQVDTPERAPQPLSERQKIPELPEAPPPILQPLMRQISIDLGLDDLTLLDLRKLDPPPALGANLIMLLGTARSEKHLHVSADRLCRWLRSNYKLRPDADGLLGRNELKLKLKRKAKRAKLMGSANDETEDDGVRTGWVCVDVGVVDGAPAEVEPEHKDFVGFGRRTDGVRIVVQMLTEEKREEIDLERLWSGILRRGTQKVIEDPVLEELEIEESTNAPEEASLNTSKDATSSNPMSQLGQIRSFHSTRVRPSLATQEAQRVPKIPYAASPAEDEIIQHVVDAPEMSLEEVFHQISFCKKHYSHLENPKWKLFFQAVLKTHLESLSADDLLKALEDTDLSITPFVTAFRDASSGPCLTESDFEAQIWLLSFARHHHIGIKAIQIEHIIQEIKISGVKITQSTFLSLIRCILTPVEYEGNKFHFQENSLYQAVEVVETMHSRGIDILQEEVLVPLLEIAAIETDTTLGEEVKDDISGLVSSPCQPMLERFHALIQQLKVPLSDESRIRLMKVYTQYDGNWEQLWDIFRMAPRRNQPNSAAIYSFVFWRFAMTGHQSACMNVLRSWVPVMEQEIPLISSEEVWGDLRACLLVAEPTVERDAMVVEQNGGFLTIWRKWSGMDLSPWEEQKMMYDEDGNRIGTE